MDFRLTEEQEALKKEFEDFFEEAMKQAPPGWEGGLEAPFATDEGFAFHQVVARKLGEKGWLSLPWPKEYGGQEHSQIEQLLFSEVTGYYRAPGVPDHGPLRAGEGIKMGTTTREI
ncbi:MAG: hypothetical protein E3J65_01010 [Dehalococcoidia bacterium]|nr:MAG: hypothetical protein E3J65_01010 [Dehalococcoidia bacterium]